MGWNFCNHSILYLGQFLFRERDAEKSVGNDWKILDCACLYMVISGLPADPKYCDRYVLVCWRNALYDAACCCIGCDSTGISI